MVQKAGVNPILPFSLGRLDLLKRAKEAEVGFSIATADDRIRKIFEPGASPVEKRIEALAVLHAAGIATFAMIAPILPGAEKLPGLLTGRVDYVLVDRLNCHYANRLYKEHGLEWALRDDFFAEITRKLKEGFGRADIPCRILF